MKHHPVLVLLCFLALNLAVMGQEEAVRKPEKPSESFAKITGGVKSISLIGEVDYPGVFIMSEPLTLRDAILLAGGLKYSSARYGYLHRRVTEGEAEQDPNPVDQTNIMDKPETPLPGTKIIKIDLQPMKNGHIPEPNLLMEAGDVLFIPRRAIQNFYVIGDVIKPGAYEIPSGQTVLASHAISCAGGPTKTARMSKGILIRRDQKGELTEKKVDYGAILKGEQEDFEVFPDDIIFIPGAQPKIIDSPIMLPPVDLPPNWRDLSQICQLPNKGRHTPKSLVSHA